MSTQYVASRQWVRTWTQRLYLDEAVTGITASLLLAFVILFISSANILVALLALVNIAGIIASILGMMVALGWELDSIESICLTILVGLSVDYVVHLANCYMESPFPDRNNRVRTALAEMGITVLGGAITSLGASAMLFACYLQFFQKFGGFMFGTILFSLLWALGFFMAAMATCGPQGNCGSILCLRRLLGHVVVDDAVEVTPTDNTNTKTGDL